MKLVPKDIQQIKQLLAMVESLLVMSAQHELGDPEDLHAFRKQRARLFRVLNSADIGFGRLISQKEAAIFEEAVHMADSIFALARARNLISPSFESDFNVLLNQVRPKLPRKKQ